MRKCRELTQSHSYRARHEERGQAASRAVPALSKQQGGEGSEKKLQVLLHQHCFAPPRKGFQEPVCVLLTEPKTYIIKGTYGRESTV